MKYQLALSLMFGLWMVCVGCGPQSSGDANAPMPEGTPAEAEMDPAAMNAEAEAAAAAAGDGGAATP